MNFRYRSIFAVLLVLLVQTFHAVDCGATPLDPACAAQTGASGTIVKALTELCTLVKNILGVGMMFMVVASALVYSIGQVMGAETRARASVWATSMFNGALIAALIYLIVPFVLRTMLQGQAGVVESINC